MRQLFSAEEKAPMQSKRAQAVLDQVRAVCLELPETSEATQFGDPAFRPGKKVFALVHANARQITLSFWVGTGGHAKVTLDPRYSVPPYMGHNGWIALNVGKRFDPNEVRELAGSSYRDYALARMRKVLDALDAPQQAARRKH